MLNNDLPFDPPTDEAGLPHVSLATLVDQLPHLEASEGTLAARRVFRWFALFGQPRPDGGECQRVAMGQAAILDGADATQQQTGPLPAASVLFICSASKAPLLLAAEPSAFALVVQESEDDPCKLDDYAGRYAISSLGKTWDLYLQINAFFTKMLAWERDLERIALKHGSLAELLDVGARVMRNFMFINDSDFNIIAYTSTIDPPDEFHRAIIQNRSLAIDNLFKERFRLPEGRFYSRGPSGGDISHTRLSAPVHFSHMYCGSISMSCDCAEDTPGLRDLFSTFLQFALPLCSEIWSKQAELRMPSAVFLVRLLEQQPMEDSYVKGQLQVLGLADMGQFKLVAIEQNEDANPAQSAAIIQATASLNGGNTYCFPFRNHMLALCFAPANRTALSRKSIRRELGERLYEPHGIMAGVSAKFFNLFDIDVAYRQACIALGYRNTILRAQASDSSEPTTAATFEDAFLYYLIDQPRKDERFLNVAFDRSIASILRAEDEQEGSNIADILWHYLGCNGSATAVARKLHIHRNTVLYHIDKIQRRFDIDLNDRIAREWAALGYKRLFLSAGNESLEKTLEDTRVGPYRITY